jgi:hypothetical protein
MLTVWVLDVKLRAHHTMLSRIYLLRNCSHLLSARLSRGFHVDPATFHVASSSLQLSLMRRS